MVKSPVWGLPGGSLGWQGSKTQIKLAVWGSNIWKENTVWGGAWRWISELAQQSWCCAKATSNGPVKQVTNLHKEHHRSWSDFIERKQGSLGQGKHVEQGDEDSLVLFFSRCKGKCHPSGGIFCRAQVDYLPAVMFMLNPARCGGITALISQRYLALTERSQSALDRKPRVVISQLFCKWREMLYNF